MEESAEATSAMVNLKDVIEELVRLTVVYGFDIGISKEYCSHLLLTHQDHPSPSPPTDIGEGVPQYPLCKHLASSLYHVISTGSFCRVYENMTLIPIDNSMKQKEEEWKQLIVEKGTELVKVLKSIGFELHVQEPFFSQLKDGLKVVEGRCAVGNYNRIGSGAMILVNKSLVLQVQDVHRYASFKEMLEAESLTEVLPGVGTVEEGVQIYRKFYTEEKERSNGVVAICVSKPPSQLYHSMASILSGLSYEGIQRLLGLIHTAGTIPQALPPPRSSLLSSFMLPYNPNVKGSTLSDGARALAKHIDRSNDKYWGSFKGSDCDKNKVAYEVIGGLIAKCCWLNMHFVAPHGTVFEIRVADGYGARWSEDGTKFIGFLEPYMEDGGRSKGGGSKF